ncbi:MAG: hypothetical protein A2073_01460 [Deltaproteobacteria bacterium GWC2_42_11]|nr:MAG: hypothetical protein A2073_01460 [Deltaproteobacteria bacterium GWC2_42_11]HBO84847.1 hypothetical protein [Deltaproteobacteria bacterium]
MRLRFFLLFLLSGIIAADIAYGKIDVKITGVELCIKCHSDMKGKFNLPYVHTPVKKGECIGCHNPHTSKFAKLVIKKKETLCYLCHENKYEKLPSENVHTPVRNGECTACHDPHASEHKSMMIRQEKELCFSCHGDMMKEGMNFSHSLFREGKCLVCHNPHASNEKGFLVKKEQDLCNGCHPAGNPAVKKSHSSFEMEKVRCSLCHDPHASNKSTLIKAYGHPFFMQKKCDACHDTASSNPFQAKAKGASLCYSCHKKSEEDFKKGAAHPLITKGDCLGCHTPHASNVKGLVKGREREFCIDCHKEIKKKEGATMSHHPAKVEGGRCTICHASHVSSQPYLLTNIANAPIMLCTGCHKEHEKFGHPTGPGIIDKRDGKSIVTCLTCHELHGSDYAMTLVLSPARDLCVLCHPQVETVQ